MGKSSAKISKKAPKTEDKPQDQSSHQDVSNQQAQNQQSRKIGKSKKQIIKDVNKSTIKTEGLDTQQIIEVIKQSMNKTYNLFVELEDQGLTNNNVSDRVHRISQQCQRVGMKAIHQYTDKAISWLQEEQRNIFKNNNDMELCYGKIKDILQDTKALNDVQIDSVLNCISKKIFQNKELIKQIDTIIERGQNLLGKPSNNS